GRNSAFPSSCKCASFGALVFECAERGRLFAPPITSFPRHETAQPFSNLVIRPRKEECFALSGVYRSRAAPDRPAIAAGETLCPHAASSTRGPLGRTTYR